MFAMGTVNCYLITGQCNTLIDCGEKNEKTWQALDKGLKNHGLAVKDIDKLVITHAHVDHMGMAQKFAEESGAKVYVSDLVYDWAVNLEKNWELRNKVMSATFMSEYTKKEFDIFNSHFTQFFNKVTDHWDSIDQDLIEVFSHDGPIDLSGRIYQSIHCPGHTISQTCFLHKETGDFISADMLLRITPTPVIDFDPDNPDKRIKGMRQLLESFKLLKPLEIKTIYPGHYEIMTDHISLIESQLSRIEHRKRQCIDLISKGTNRYLALFNTLYANPMNFPGLTMTLGYLDLLQDDDKIIREQTSDGAVYWLK